MIPSDLTMYLHALLAAFISTVCVQKHKEEDGIYRNTSISTILVYVRVYALRQMLGISVYKIVLSFDLLDEM